MVEIAVKSVFGVQQASVVVLSVLLSVVAVNWSTIFMCNSLYSGRLVLVTCILKDFIVENGVSLTEQDCHLSVVFLLVWLVHLSYCHSPLCLQIAYV